MADSKVYYSVLQSATMWFIISQRSASKMNDTQNQNGFGVLGSELLDESLWSCVSSNDYLSQFPILQYHPGALMESEYTDHCTQRF
ncbi:hypothetical protein CEXT_40261 [Caerostris extrusa]|uniref:Uncharacterized protein n=1 Tax=Caerostris extrusa TaxID=172846 RepID=A0AAV4UP10_CAEEX|nr:hypothetical protein CEXT_40261 [Caerostris extrusa]